jgi:hypothetical protein
MSYLGGERIHGIDAPLPPGERVRWEGKPALRSLARRAFHVRTIVLYFGLLAAARVAYGLATGQEMAAVSASAASLMTLGLLAAALSYFLAWLSERTTVYAVTDRRLVLRVGMVVPATINIPFRLIEKVDTRRFPDGTADFAVTLAGSERIPYVQLWPHARPWRFTLPQPMLRSVPDADRVSALFGDALASHASMETEPALPDDATRVGRRAARDAPGTAPRTERLAVATGP